MPTTEQTFVSLSPADDATIATYPLMSATHVTEIVDQARIAASWWSDLSPRERRSRLLQYTSLVINRADELAELVHTENGKPLEDAYLEIVLTTSHMEWAAKNADKAMRRRSVRPSLLTLNQASAVEYQPVGVVGVIGPWNYPVFTPMGSIIYALATGNAVVYKPSEYTTAVGEWLMNAFAEVVPEQPVAQLVTGSADTGAALCRAGVDKISFTGSTATGKKVMATCAESLTPVVMECGGKDAVLVDRDADLNKAADLVAFGAFSNAGQTCAGVELVYAHQDIYDEFLRLLVERTVPVQPGTASDAAYGPMTMRTQTDVVRRHIDSALQSGGEAAVGGPDSVGARVIDPVLLTGVPEDSESVREETFGPVVIVNRVRDLEDAVDRVNGSSYGLGASIFSGSRKRMEHAAARLQVGMVSMNSWLLYAGTPALPWGGVKQSGFGRLHGIDGLREFTRSKSTTRERFPLPIALTSFSRLPQTTKIAVRVHQFLQGRYGR